MLLEREDMGNKKHSLWQQHSHYFLSYHAREKVLLYVFPYPSFVGQCLYPVCLAQHCPNIV